MYKLKFFIATLVAGIFSASLVQAQSKSSVDPGISTHNYKHPNKAAQARESETKIRVSNLGTVERYVKNRRSGYSSSTPKYAVRPASLVLIRTSPKEGLALNPLTSPRNYKTSSGFTPAKTYELADIEMTPDSVYPNRD